MRGESPIAIQCVRPVAAGALVWRRSGRLSLTLVVKARLALVNDGVARLEAAPELLNAAVAKARGLESELVPYKPRVDVTYVGAAWAPRPVQALKARFALHGKSESVERAVQVVGERASMSAQPAPFVRMPLVPERAWRGPGGENPRGIDERSGRVANLFDPQDPKLAVGLGPVPRDFPVRQRLLGNVDPRSLETETPATAEGVAALDLPAALPFDFFSVAPIDQRLDHFAGDETLVLENLVEGQSRLHTRLPGIQALARLFSATLPPQGQALELVADTVAIDGGDRSVSITWRGTLVVPGNERLLASFRAQVGVEYPGYAMQWPAASLNTTMELEAPSPEPGRARAAVPIVDEETQNIDDEPPNHTKALSPEEAMKLLAGAPRPLPFGGSAPAAPPPKDAAPPEPRTDRTLTPEEAEALAMRLGPRPPDPFAVPAPSPAVSPPAVSPPAVVTPPAPVVPAVVPPVDVRSPPVAPAAVAPPRMGPQVMTGPLPAVAARPVPAGARPGSPPGVVVRVQPPADLDDEDSAIGSTIAFSPEAAAELIARRVAAAGKAPGPAGAPNPPPPAPPPPAFPPLPFPADDPQVDSTRGSTVAFSPEAAAELIAQRMGRPVPPAPPPPPPAGPTLTRSNTVVMDAPSEVDSPPAGKSR